MVQSVCIGRYCFFVLGDCAFYTAKLHMLYMHQLHGNVDAQLDVPKEFKVAYILDYFSQV